MFNCVSKHKVASFLCIAALTACNKMKTADELLAEARQYQQNGDHKAAIIQLKNAIQKNPDLIETRYFLGAIYNEIGDAQSAEKELRKAMSLGMDHAKVMPDICKALIVQGKYQSVLDETRPMPEPDSNSVADAYISVLRANSYFALGKTRESKNIFERILKQQPDNPDALIGLAKHALLDKDNKSATRYAEQATERNPKNIDAWLFMGDLLRSQGLIEPALNAYDRVLHIKPDNISANIAKAYLHISQKEFAAAKLNIEAARKTDPAHIIVYYAQGLLDYNMGNYSSARDALQQVLRVAPGHMPSLLLAGAVQFALGSMPQAEQHLKQYLEKNPDNLYARKLLATTFLKSDQADKALAVLKPALIEDQQDARLLAIAGDCFMQKKEFVKATEYFERASLLAPEAAHIHTSLGLSKLAQGDNSRAMSELEQAVSLDQSSPQAGLILAITQLRLKQYDKALMTVQALEKAQADNPLLQNLKGGIYRAQKDIAGARASFNKALALQPAFVPAAENLAQLEMQENQPELAKKHYMDILLHDKKSIQAMMGLARLAQSQGKDGEATNWLEHANKENPDSLTVAMKLAVNYLQRGEKSKALTLVKNFQAINPGNTDLLQLLAQAQLANNMQAAALETLHKLSLMMPESAVVQLDIGKVHLSMNNFQAATEALKKSLLLRPDFVDALVAQVALELRQSNYSRALLIAREIQKKNQKSALGYVVEADVLMAQKKTTAAIAAYELALALNKNGSIVVKLHGALKQAGKGQEADSRLLLWLKDYPADHAVRMYLASTYLAEKKNRDAIEQFQILLQQNPNNPALLNNLAWAYHQENDMRALEYAEKAYINAANSPAVLDTMGWILAEQGDIRRGLPLLQKAVSLAPEAADIRYHLAQGLVRAGDKAAARKELEKLLESGKTFSDYSAVKDLLKQL